MGIFNLRAVYDRAPRISCLFVSGIRFSIYGQVEYPDNTKLLILMQELAMAEHLLSVSRFSGSTPKETSDRHRWNLARLHNMAKIEERVTEFINAHRVARLAAACGRTPIRDPDLLRRMLS